MLVAKVLSLISVVRHYPSFPTQGRNHKICLGKTRGRFIYILDSSNSSSFTFWSTVFPHIVAAATILFWTHLVRKLFKFSLHKRKINAETIWIFQSFTISKKNSCCSKYMRKYGSWVMRHDLYKIDRKRKQLLDIFFSQYRWKKVPYSREF